MSNIDKNNAIRESIRATRIKRKSQTCKTFKFKVDKSSLSKSQSEALKMFFIETKRVYNHLLNETNNGKDLFTFDYKELRHIKYYDKDKNLLEYDIKYIGSSIISDTITLMKDSIKGLSASKKAGNKVGALKFKSECNRIRLRQYNITHSLRGNRIKIQGIKTPIRVNGIKQLNKYSNIEYTTADILYDGYDYFISLVCYIDKEYNTVKNNNIVGIDLGCSTTITTSDGEKVSILIEESDRLKGLQKKISKQVKRSNNWYKTRSKIRKEYNRMNNKKNDISNKIIHKLTSSYGTIVIQNDQISEWKDNIKSKTIQHSILGRLKSKLAQNPNVIILDQWFPTTKYCPSCKKLNNIELSDRIYKCECGYECDRDIHAAKNMVDFYINYKSVGTPDLMPIKKVSYSNYKKLLK